MASKYYIKVNSEKEVIFEGPLNLFKSQFYKTEDSVSWTDEDILECARAWAADNDWNFEAGACH